MAAISRRKSSAANRPSPSWSGTELEVVTAHRGFAWLTVAADGAVRWAPAGAEAALAAGICMVQQHLALVPTFSAVENAVLFARGGLVDRAAELGGFLRAGLLHCAPVTDSLSTLIAVLAALALATLLLDAGKAGLAYFLAIWTYGAYESQYTADFTPGYWHSLGLIAGAAAFVGRSARLSRSADQSVSDAAFSRTTSA